MDGWPVWLASVSHRGTNGQIVPAARWGPYLMAQAEQLIERALDGVGDEGRQREFRMTVTLCRHRALTVEERDALPAWWHAARPTHLAGGPVAVLWERGCGGTPSTQPCASPGHQLLAGPARPDLWLPQDCGECESCMARSAIQADVGAGRWGTGEGREAGDAAP